ncbi:hypothetical protein [Kiloniella sp.]|uniref:hypothetical protein n=1 Tax=Kiloniella sp. TaxID=1938587 RepID=UPI003B02E551
MSNTPAEHKEENQKLAADSYVDLFQIVLRSGSRVYLKNNNDRDWQGNTYEGTSIKLSEVRRSSDEEQSRPTLSIANPKGIYSPLIRDGDLDRATLIRYRVLSKNLTNNLAVFERNSWTFWRPTLITGEVATFELRQPLDGYNFTTPARTFSPPEFPAVSLT